MKNRLHLIFLLTVLSLGSQGCRLFLSSNHRIEDYKLVHSAAEGGDLTAVQTFVGTNASLVGAKDWDNLTPLHLAVFHRHKDVAEFLLEHGADVNAKTTAGVTPLHFAAQTANQQLIELLLAHKAKINAVDSKGRTPLDRAEQWKHPKMAEWLEQHGGLSKPQQFYPPRWFYVLPPATKSG